LSGGEAVNLFALTTNILRGFKPVFWHFWLIAITQPLERSFPGSCLGTHCCRGSCLPLSGVMSTRTVQRMANSATSGLSNLLALWTTFTRSHRHLASIDAMRPIRRTVFMSVHVLT